LGEELDEIQWGEQDEIELEKIENVLFDGAVFEDLELVLTPSLNLVDDLSWVHSGDLDEFRGQEQALGSHDFQILWGVLEVGFAG